MSGYSVALFFHFVSLVAAVAAAALAGYAGFRLRGVESAAAAQSWAALIGRAAPVFPVASAGLLASGAYMTHEAWSWSTPWIVTGLIGLGLIALLGAGVERSRGRAAVRELRAAGLSARARSLLRDPIAWSSKVTTWTLMVAVMFVMTAKPGAGACAASLAGAVVGGVLAAVPVWRVGPSHSDFAAAAQPWNAE